MKFQTFGNQDTEIVIIPWVMTWDGVVRELGVRLEASRLRYTAVDWLALVGGYGKTGWNGFAGLGKHQELEAALKELSDFEKSREKIFGQSQLQGAIRGFANGLGRGFLGYQVQGGYTFSDDGIVRKNGEYKSTYDGAQWPSTSSELQKCALIFLGSAYVTYYFITVLYWACSGAHLGPWKSWTLGGTGERLKDYMETMGYTSIQLKGEMYGTQIAKLLDSDFNGFTELKKPTRQTLYSDFLSQLEDQHKQVDWNHPLIGCYLLANCYFSLNKASPAAQAMEKINIEFKKLRGYGSDDYSTLKQNIQTFLSNVTTFMPTPAGTAPQQPSPGSSTTSSQSSSAGPVAGTLTTFGLGGGAAAAYIFNLGGAKTLVNGLLRIG